MMEDYQRQPLPAVLHDSMALEFSALFEELPREIGVPVWQVLRDATLWISSPVSCRPALFSKSTSLDAGLPSDVGGPLASMLRGMKLHDVVGINMIASACLEIADWAVRHGYLATALAYTQCGALAIPGDANLAFKVGRLAVEHAEYSRADSWFRRALTLARRMRDWDTYILCILGLGTIYRKRGKLPLAEEFFRRALQRARRHRRRTIAAMAYHDLFGTAIFRGRIDEAEKYARQACRLYGPHDPRLLRLANDVAYQWINQGQFARAVPILRSLLPHLQTPSLRLIALTNLVRATGGARMPGAFQAAWASAMVITRRSGSEGVASECLLEMAHGAISCGEWRMAEAAARAAHGNAVAHGQTQVVFAAEALLESLSSERRAELSNPATGGESVPADDRLDTELLSALC